MALKALAAVAVVALGGWVWNAQQRDEPAGQSRVALATGGPTNQTGGPASAEPGASTSPPATAGSPTPVTGATSSTSPVLSGKELAELGLTRQLAGDHLVTMEDRPHRILGSKEVPASSGGSEPMLVIRDEVSGQIHYRLSGLQFTLKPGVDYEAFIREHSAMRRIFVNSLYAQVGVDAAQIAGQYMALSKDDRIEKLRFMTLRPVHTPK